MRIATTLLVAALGFCCGVVQAQNFPTRPVRLIVPYAAAGPADETARALGNKLSELWGQPVVIENRGGGGGSIGALTVAKAAPDGYTILLGNAGPLTINPYLMKQIPYDAQKDFEPITLMLTTSQVLLVSPRLPVRSVPELVALAKSQPGKLNYGSAGIGGSQHLAMEALASVSGTKMLHVPYKGTAPAYADLIAGQIDLMFGNMVGALPQIEAGHMRPVGVSSLTRQDKLPNIASISETFPGFEVISWQGLLAPRGTPRQVIDKIRADVAIVFSRPDMKSRAAAQGTDIVVSTPEQLREFMQKESALYEKIIKSTGMVAE